jgi:hypothetical protein
MVSRVCSQQAQQEVYVCPLQTLIQVNFVHCDACKVPAYAFSKGAGCETPVNLIRRGHENSCAFERVTLFVLLHVGVQRFTPTFAKPNGPGDPLAINDEGACVNQMRVMVLSYRRFSTLLSHGGQTRNLAPQQGLSWEHCDCC